MQKNVITENINSVVPLSQSVHKRTWALVTNFSFAKWPQSQLLNRTYPFLPLYWFWLFYFYSSASGQRKHNWPVYTVLTAARLYVRSPVHAHLKFPVFTQSVPFRAMLSGLPAVPEILRNDLTSTITLLRSSIICKTTTSLPSATQIRLRALPFSLISHLNALSNFHPSPCIYFLRGSRTPHPCLPPHLLVLCHQLHRHSSLQLAHRKLPRALRMIYNSWLHCHSFINQKIGIFTVSTVQNVHRN